MNFSTGFLFTLLAASLSFLSWKMMMTALARILTAEIAMLSEYVLKSFPLDK